MTTSEDSKSVMEELIKKENLTWEDFLETIWEKKCHRFSFGNEQSINATSSDGNSGLWSKMVNDGWKILTNILNTTHPMRPSNGTNTNNSTQASPPLLFRDLQPMDDPEEIQQLFGTSLYAAYMAGTSIVWNHVEEVSPNVAELCQNLQQFSFPHAYANAYLTPPNSQTVPAHADDRDVLVFQLMGTKHWKVYENVPIPHPYTHEQVGKSGLPVPDSVLRGPMAFDGCLKAGDVLYLPRGMVHEASTETALQDMSFHITVALATHDWTLGGNLGRMIQQQLSETTSLRLSLLPTINASTEPNDDFVSCGGRLVNKKKVQTELDTIFEKLRSQITADALLRDMNQRIETHNDRASQKRASSKTTTSQISKDETFCENDTATASLDRVVGPLATQNLTLDSMLRASTPIEKEHAQQKLASLSASKPGLTVRDGVGDDVATIVGAIKGGETCKVGDFSKFCAKSSSLCNLTALSLAKRAVELGAFCVVPNNNTDGPNPKKQRTN